MPDHVLNFVLGNLFVNHARISGCEGICRNFSGDDAASGNDDGIKKTGHLTERLCHQNVLAPSM